MSNSEVLIGVMGVTGSGKSTFIQTVSGDRTIVVSDGLNSCTAEVRTSKPFKLDGRTVRLVDTPGFNDTTRSDTEVLQLIGNWMKKSYDSNTKLTGILYLHRITDTRMEGTSVRCLNLFRSICGDNFMENTILVSTMWDRATGSTSKYEQNEEQLRNDFWKIFLAGGATMTRSKNSVASSQTILRHLLDKLPAIPQMQHELGVEGRNLGDTTAGEELRAETIEMQKKFDEQLAAAKEEYRRALDENNKKMQKMLQEACAKYEHKIQNIESELEILKANRNEGGVIVSLARAVERVLGLGK